MTNTSRPWLYVMVFLGTLSAWFANYRTQKTEKNISNLERQIQTLATTEGKPILQKRNVTGNLSQDLFYVVNGKDTAFVKIDGRSVQNYFKTDSSIIPPGGIR